MQGREKSHLYKSLGLNSYTIILVSIQTKTLQSKMLVGDFKSFLFCDQSMYIFALTMHGWGSN